MRPPLTKSQIERLGARLVQGSKSVDADLELLHEVLGMYSEVLAGAVERVIDGLGVSPTSRIKNTGTILEKLRRNGGHGLRSIQDLAGMRVADRCDRHAQDAVVSQLVDLFRSARRPPKIVDRRSAPVHGYRAVHVIVFPEDVPVEIQVRTIWQHEWAELFEKLADWAGRGIRYGEPPLRWWTPAEFDAMDAHEQWLVSIHYGLRTTIVEQALAVADMIDAVESAEAAAPEDPDLDGYRRRVDERLAALRTSLEGL